jgi:hypothetical protein
MLVDFDEVPFRGTEQLVAPGFREHASDASPYIASMQSRPTLLADLSEIAVMRSGKAQKFKYPQQEKRPP